MKKLLILAMLSTTFAQNQNGFFTLNRVNPLANQNNPITNTFNKFIPINQNNTHVNDNTDRQTNENTNVNTNNERKNDERNDKELNNNQSKGFFETIAKPFTKSDKKDEKNVGDVAAKGKANDNLAKNIEKGIQTEIQSVLTPIDETIVFVGSSQCSKVKKILGVSYDHLKGDDGPDLDKLSLQWNDGSVQITFNIKDAARTIPLARGYNPHKPLIIFIHGFTDDPSSANAKNISRSFQERGECNVLAFDGSSLIKWLYLRSTTYVRFMGQELGATLAAMVNSGVDPSKIHIIGHSLGAHISGFTGKTFSNLTGSKVGRITGLDPAGPCFSNVDPELRLKASDAEFVDVIHTDAGVYGLKENVGQVDFFVNSGQQQPNCLFQTCSHSRAVVYFAESIVSQDAFPAVKCKDWEQFRQGKCQRNDVAMMGYACKPGIRGQYYLQTNGESLYGRHQNGLKFENNEGVIRNLLG